MNELKIKDFHELAIAMNCAYLLTQGNVHLAFGHRSREVYALTHLAPTKRYQRFA